ncbi:selenide,water dikinase [Fusibacter tunisiensis]|uniref:Selenide, water dikinase n=1 Tax=Fusibacter tunisiensis TaxID=1008308 RepID=A0ABS2MMW0_9FIRM|nr:selenide,water dikinase [Fusibacter tunisiensis]
MGFDASDDAAVYKLNETQALIQTLDFFTPIVDDPYTFGTIAATNALSDVYAMGGEPTLALNIVGFPNCLSPLILKDILRGGADKVKEAGALLVGGHSIEDEEPKYGLSVSGIVHPEKIWTNIGASDGDVLILTKPLGIGVLTTALKEEMTDAETYDEIVHIMTYLNKYPYEVLKNYEVHACTDVTGFGFLGHALEMAKGSNVTIKVNVEDVPFIKAAIPFAEMGIIPAGAYRNRAHALSSIEVDPEIEEVYLDLLFDPQTSGGLLVAVPESQAIEILGKLNDVCEIKSHIVGNVVAKKEMCVILKNIK